MQNKECCTPQKNRINYQKELEKLLCYTLDKDYIDVADIAAVEEEIRSGKPTKLSSSFTDEYNDLDSDELDTIVDEGSFDDL